MKVKVPLVLVRVTRKEAEGEGKGGAVGGTRPKPGGGRLNIALCESWEGERRRGMCVWRCEGKKGI